MKKINTIFLAAVVFSLSFIDSYSTHLTKMGEEYPSEWDDSKEERKIPSILESPARPSAHAPIPTPAFVIPSPSGFADVDSFSLGIGPDADSGGMEEPENKSPARKRKRVIPFRLNSQAGAVKPFKVPRRDPTGTRTAIAELNNRYLTSFHSLASSFSPRWPHYDIWDVDFTLDPNRKAERELKAKRIVSYASMLKYARDWATDWFVNSLNGILTRVDAMKAMGALTFGDVMRDEEKKVHLIDAVMGSMTLTQKSSERRGLPRESLSLDVASYAAGVLNLQDLNPVLGGYGAEARGLSIASRLKTEEELLEEEEEIAATEAEGDDRTLFTSGGVSGVSVAGRGSLMS